MKRTITNLTLCILLLTTMLAFCGCSNQQKISTDSTTTNPTTEEHNSENATSTVTPPEKDETIMALIEEYNLNDMADIIYENQDFFKKYSDTLLANSNLENYRSQIFNLFKVIIDNKEYVDEAFLLKKLSALTITIDTSIAEKGHAGEYYRNSASMILTSTVDAVIYHELMHFLDFAFYHNTTYNVYDVDGKLVQDNTDNGEYVGSCYSRFIEEAGAEVMTSKYITEYTQTYDLGVQFMNGLEYIFGTEKIKELFFGPDYLFMKLFLDNGYTYSQFESINEDLSNSLMHSDFYSPNNFLLDVLIDLYTKNKTDQQWYEDEEFIYILRCYTSLDIDYSPSKYDKLRELQLDEWELLNYFSHIVEELSDNLIICSNGSRGTMIFKDQKRYLQFEVCDTTGGESIIGYLTILYDFENETIIEYSFVEKPAELDLNIFLD